MSGPPHHVPFGMKTRRTPIAFPGPLVLVLFNFAIKPDSIHSTSAGLIRCMSSILSTPWTFSRRAQATTFKGHGFPRRETIRNRAAITPKGNRGALSTVSLLAARFNHGVLQVPLDHGFWFSGKHDLSSNYTREARKNAETTAGASDVFSAT